MTSIELASSIKASLALLPIFIFGCATSANVEPTAINFPNGVANSLDQTLPLFDPKATIQSKVVDGLNYRLYQIQGEFKGSYDFRDYPFDRQKLKIYFQNAQVPSDRLIYVIDTVGLRLSGSNKSDQQKPYQSLQSWRFEDLLYAQETVSSTSTKGNPRLFNSNLRIDYPGLSSTITVQRRFSVFLIKTLPAIRASHSRSFQHPVLFRKLGKRAADCGDFGAAFECGAFNVD